jgi:hypothetical protein
MGFTSVNRGAEAAALAAPTSCRRENHRVGGRDLEQQQTHRTAAGARRAAHRSSADFSRRLFVRVPIRVE